MKLRILYAALIPLILLVLIQPSGTEAASSPPGTFTAPGDHIIYDFTQSEDGKLPVYGSLSIDVPADHETSGKFTVTGAGNLSFPAGTGVSEVAYYTSGAALAADVSNNHIANASQVVSESTNYSFSNTYTRKQMYGPGRETLPVSVMEMDEGGITGIIFRGVLDSGSANFTYFQVLHIPDVLYYQLDFNNPPDNIRHEAEGLDFEYFGKVEKAYGSRVVEVHSYNNDGVYHLDFSSVNGLLTFYGFHDLTAVNGQAAFRYELRETNIKMTPNPVDEEIGGSLLARYLPAIVSLAFFGALGIEVITGRYHMMLNRKKAIFLTVILLIACSFLSLQFLVLKDDERILPTHEKLLNDKYDLEMSGLESDLKMIDGKHVAALNFTIKNTGRETFIERSVEVVFVLQKFGQTMYYLNGPDGERREETRIYDEFAPGSTYRVNYNMPLGNEDPKWIDLKLTIRLEVATDAGDFIFVETPVQL